MTILIYSILNLGIAFLALYGFTGIRYDWSVDILLCKPGHDGPTLARSDSPYWSHARKVTNFVTFGQCLHIHTHKKINDPPGFIVLQTQLAFTIGSRNEQAILDSYQSEIFCYTMNPLMIKPREYKLSWPSLYGQDYWILASFFFYFFMDRDFVSVHKNAKKKKNSANI